MKNLTLGGKLYLILVLMWVGLVSFGVWSAWNTRSILTEERRTKLRANVEIAESVVKGYAARVDSGELTVAEAQKRAIANISAMRFNPEGYFVVQDQDFIALVHANQKIVGKSQRDFKDTNGKYFIQEQRRQIDATGEAQVDYSFPHPGDTVPAPKITYAKLFKPWGWTIFTGAYVDSIELVFYSELKGIQSITIAIGLLLTALTYLVIRNVARSLGGEPSYAAEIASRIADGDLAFEINVKGDNENSMLGTMRRMQRQLSATVGQIRQGTDTIEVGAGEIAAGNLDLSSRTEQQASSLAETSASMGELTSAVQQNTDNARQAGELAGSASRIAERGGEVVSKVVETMRGINDSSLKMVDIISVIDSIAFQTNILALNAAVEAARAGEQGRGFAVVATEVRTLAQRSAQAAREIKGLIDDSVARVGNGSGLVEKAGATMKEMMVAVDRVTNIVGDISSASERQSTWIGQINDAMMQMDQVTQQNAALVEEAAAAAASLEGQAKRLKQAVEIFKTEDARSMAAAASANASTPPGNVAGVGREEQSKNRYPQQKLALPVR